MNHVSSKEEHISWPQIWSLLLLMSAVSISWIAYHEYLPKLLEKFDLESYASFTNWSQTIVMFVVPIVAGYFADTYGSNKQKMNLPLINLGIIFTAVIFMVVAFGNASFNPFNVAALVPFLILAWLIGMNTFYAPAMASLDSLVSDKNLPKVFLYFVLVNHLLYALEPSITAVLDYLGAAITFAVGGVLILSTGWFLRGKLTDMGERMVVPETTDQYESGWFFKALKAGLLLGLPTGVAFQLFPKWFQEKLSFIETVEIGYFVVSGILVISGLLAVTLAKRINDDNIRKFVYGGSIGALLMVAVINMTTSETAIVVLALLFSVGFALVAISAFPLTFRVVPRKYIATGVGAFYAGLEVVDNLLQTLY